MYVGVLYWGDIVTDSQNHRILHMLIIAIVVRLLREVMAYSIWSMLYLRNLRVCSPKWNSDPLFVEVQIEFSTEGSPTFGTHIVGDDNYKLCIDIIVHDAHAHMHIHTYSHSSQAPTESWYTLFAHVQGCNYFSWIMFWSMNIKLGILYPVGSHRKTSLPPSMLFVLEFRR